MKSRLLISLSVLAVIIFVGCGNKKENQDLTPPQGMTYLDISRTGMNLNVLIPDSTVGLVDTIMQSWGAYEIKVGKDFQISIEESDGDIEMIKSDNANNDVNKLKQYLVQEPNTLVWESGIADMSEFHFYHVTKIGTRSYVIQDIKGEPFSKSAIEKMLEVVKQIKEIKKGEPQS